MASDVGAEGLYRDLWEVGGRLLTYAEIQAAYTSGTLGPDTRARKLGDRSWTTLSRIAGIGVFPPPLPSAADTMTPVSSEVEIVDIPPLPPFPPLPPPLSPPLSLSTSAFEPNDATLRDVLDTTHAVVPPSRPAKAGRVYGKAAVVSSLGLVGGAAVALASVWFFGPHHGSSAAHPTAAAPPPPAELPVPEELAASEAIGFAVIIPAASAPAPAASAADAAAPRPPLAATTIKREDRARPRPIAGRRSGSR